ncbi:GNAT family N-acetyltransferase [Lentzea flaviverrucosa]|uniref:Predicted acetyltransferase n=1 Tax=Lentzea flaviverrucosa TaxID=200379 RepID=A0A1H9M6N0_9PSEU|nr:GNAT family N-acetyltransferase [Lentzea flaviverrucosa]RDI31070.1 putative acetyltransferase [Lentzea flaviverrucosa]SER18783.1 Predicted acetyltransferase [Lentzea flaviverrucosa]
MQIREFTEDDRDAVFRLRRVAFNGTKPSGPLLRPGSHGLLAEIDGRVAGVLGIGSYAQFYGGAAVPMGGIGGVAVDGSYRGRGIANALLDAALTTMREHGQPLSVLYATVPTLYRRRGWERTGVFEWVELPMDRLLSVPKPAELIPSRPAEKSDLPALHECYLEVARTIDGMADRRPPRMDLGKVLEMDLVTVLPGPNGLRGYLTATREPGGDTGRLKVHDLIGVDVEAQLNLLASLASWAGTLEAIDLRITDPATIGFLGGTPIRHSVWTSTWMQRVVDLPAAVAARGWPRLANAAVDLEVVDDHAPWHAGLRRLVVEDGSVRVEPGGTGAVRLHARALGPWFAGAQNTHALRRGGLLEGDPADAAVLDQLTGSSGTPRLADFF